ncbi:MAG: hypothetical protein HDS13_07590 [Bacteroides sp.]|nr:hypothetical protein [Bacteroides sp.]
MKRFRLYILSVPLLLSAACAGTEQPGNVNTGIEQAKIDGRSYARLIVNRNWAGDTMGLQNNLLEVRARQSRYILEGHREEAAAFDSAFLSTLRAVEPQLANKLTAPALDSDTK